MPLDTALTQVLGFASALAVAYFTGAWRQYGRRMERLLDLASKLPKDSPARKEFEAAAEREADSAAQTLRQPRSVRFAAQVVGVYLFFTALGLTTFLWEDPWREALRFYAFEVGRMAGEAQRDGAPAPMAIGLAVATMAFFFMTMCCLFGVLVPWWWRGDHVRAARHKLLHIVRQRAWAGSQRLRSTWQGYRRRHSAG